VKSQPGGWTPEEIMKVKGVGNVQVSPDGRRVVFTVAEAVMTDDKSENLTHIHVANADGTDAYQFTYGDKSCSNPQWSPDGRWVAFTSGRSGKENLWLMRAAGGEAQQLTEVKTGVGAYRWSPDGSMIAFLMREPSGEAEEKSEKGKNDARVVDDNIKMSQLWVVPIEKDVNGKREARQLTKARAHVGNGFDWSPDGRTIAYSHTPTPVANDWPLADISTVDVASGEVRPLAQTRAAENDPRYSPDGRWMAFTASDDPPTWGGTASVFVMPISGGPRRQLAETADRQPNLIGWSADGQKVYFTETRGTVTRLSALPIDGSAPQDIDRGDSVMFGVNLNHTRTMAGFSAQTSDRAAEAFVARLDRFGPTQISRANAGLPNHPTGRTEVIRWRSTDGMEIQGLLSYPVGYQPGTRYPLLLIIHGGPAGVYTQTYIANRGPYPIAAFAAQGYAVLRCNVRGSSGYGKAFRYANYKDWGGMDYQDLMTGVDQVIRMGVADPDRLGVMGWSYGGFMTSWVITQTKRFKAASVGAGVTNLMSFTGTADIPSFIPDYFGAEFWDHPEVYRNHSAMFNVKGVSTPTLIQHGERDERVPISQGYELYNALKRQGVTTKMVVYPRTPHGIQEPKLQLDAAKRNLEWFNQYLGLNILKGK
jgi:dipeptidyl aminopeptidase/acylaminoacyl peptidase